jgi:hypothetical protein
MARVLAIDIEKRHVSLTLRRPHPWLDRVGLPAVGSRVTGTVVKVDEEGVRSRRSRSSCPTSGATRTRSCPTGGTSW